jgi:predicted DNA binding CopG/RHH family protein
MRRRKGNKSTKKRATKPQLTHRAIQAPELSQELQLLRPTQLAKREQIIAPGIEDVTEIVRFIENYKRMLDPRAQRRSKLISIKIPEPLLAAFRYKAESERTPYQTKIKELMLEYLER